MKRLYFTICALCLTSFAVAQSDIASSVESLSSRSNARGVVMNGDMMSVAQMGQFAQSTFQYGTARSMAMAGAMTSLGGDGSSMMINPAGLGMYRGGDVSITPLVTLQRSETYGGGSLSGGENSFSLSNFSTVFNLYESGDGALVSLNMGLGYNKIANLNYSFSAISSGNSSSIARLFSRQLTGDGVTLNNLYGNSNPDWNSISTGSWGAVLGYKTGLTFQSYGSTPEGYSALTPSDEIIEASDPIWDATWMSSSTVVDQYMEVVSDGSIGEYDIALGGNIMNKLYFGFTLGIQHVYQRLDIYYGEEYTNSSQLDGELNYVNYNQSIITSGAGVNMKMGLTFRPLEALRIGVAYHTPTWYSLSRVYQASMASAASVDGEVLYSSVDSPILEDYGENRWRFNSPSRLLLGGSYIFAQRALVSVDYQRDWYGGMKVRDLPYGVDSALYDGFDECYESVNTLRIGSEIKFTPSLCVRAGYGHSSSLLRSDITTAELLDNPTTDRIEYFSAGVGYSPNQALRLDLTYMNQTTHMSSYTLFYADGTVGSSVENGSAIPSAESAQSGSFTSKLKSHNIAFTMTFKM